ADARRPPQGKGDRLERHTGEGRVRRVSPARPRPVGDHAAGLSVPKRSDRRVVRTRKGDFELRLPAGERDILRSLPGQLRELLTTDDPALERLFPPAYKD